LIIAGCRIVFPEIIQNLSSIWNKEEMPEDWMQSIIVPISKKGDKTDCNNYRAISHLSITYKFFFNILLSRLTPYARNLQGIISVDFDAVGRILIM